MYKIGELSKLCNISVKALRYYDAEGLLVPDKIDKFTGYRYYSASKLIDCYRIIALKELGFSLDEIRVQLTINDSEKIVKVLDAKLVELKSLIETTKKQFRKIESIKNMFIGGESKMFNVIISATDEIRVAFVRKNYHSKSDALCEADEIAKNLPQAVVGKRRLIIAAQFRGIALLRCRRLSVRERPCRPRQWSPQGPGSPFRPGWNLRPEPGREGS